MAKNSVLNRPHVESRRGRSAKDLSRELNFNQSAGMLIPVLSQFCVKGTKGVINRRVFTRTAQVVSPAFDRVTQHIDFFKIPLRLLYSPFNDWSLNINDLNSSLMLSKVPSADQNVLPQALPSVDFSSLFDTIFDRSRFSGSNIDYQMTKAYNDGLRLLDFLGYGRSCISSSGSNVMNLLKLAAYQKCYFDYYRNTAYESNNAYYYNLDWAMSSPLISLTDNTSVAILNGMFTLRYVNYRNDYFHNIYPHLNYVSSIPVGSDWKIPSSVLGVQSGGGDVSILPVYGISASMSPQIRTVKAAGSGDTGYFNIQSIRAAFALDKLMRASAYAPKHVRDQFKARFGVDPGNKVSGECDRIGSYVNDVIFGEVTATSGGQTGTTSGGSAVYSQLGDIGGKGIGSSQNDEDLHFYCEEDSIIMGLQYFMPKGFYDSIGMDDFNAYSVREDFPQPEFENLGLRPLYAKTLSNQGSATDRNVIIGYTVPQQCLKLGIDWNHGLFNRDMLLFNAPTTAGTGQPVGFTTSGALMSFATHVDQYRIMAQSPTAATAALFKVVPNDLDSIFKLNYSAIGNEFNDQFYGWMRIKLAIVNWQSIHGQPSL